VKPCDLKSFHPGTLSPNHAGIIPDGTRRWARINHVSLADAYMQAVVLLQKIVVSLLEEGIHEISIYLSSEQNFKRSREEVDAFCRAEAHFCDALLPGIAESFGLKVVAVGNMEIVPGYLRDALEALTGMTASKTAGRINLCAAYNPLEEVSHAAKHAVLLNGLQVKTPLDLVIRTGGANLLSNFLPLQSGFARLYFLDKLFNELEVDDIRQIVSSFREIGRNYGE